PETRQSAHLKVKGSFWSDILVPTIRHPRFLTVVAPIAPWVFGAAGVAYAITPRLVQDQVGSPVAFSGLLTVIALASGFTIQQFGPRINTSYNARGPIVALVLVIVGMAVAAVASRDIAVWSAIVVAIILGAAYGLCLISGLTEVQRIAGPDDLAGLTAAYYTLTYIGFFFPMILTRLSANLSYPVMLGAGVVVAVVFLVIVTVFSRKNIPAQAD
ncbi:MAG: MFS transporter, partial [Corynebacterium sp.]|nr:MFS transporter [Corynebacterium sp.]